MILFTEYNVLLFLWSIVVKRRTGTKTTAAAAKDKDVVQYTSETLQIGPNIAYEDVTYPQEVIYETPK